MVARHDQLKRVRAYFERVGYSERDRIPPERELAAELGMTRARIRVCLRKLAAEGMIWRHVGKGTFFGPRPDAVKDAPVHLAFADLTNPREVIEARIAVEPELARMATQRATGKDFQAMRECLDRMLAAEGPAAWLLWDRQFHRAIAEAAGNRLMLAMFDAIHASREREVWGRLRDAVLSPERMKEVGEQHEALYEALVVRDAEHAAALMQGHIRAVRARIFAESPAGSPEAR